VAVAVLGVAALGLSLVLTPADAADGPIVCPFRLLTGLPCPGCGLTRSWVFLAHGRVTDALSANPFGPVTMAAAIALVIAVCWAVVRRRPLPDLDRIALALPTRIVLVGWLAFAACRLLAVLTGHATG